MARRFEFELGLIRTDRGEFTDKGNIAVNPRHFDFNGGAAADGLNDDGVAWNLARAHLPTEGGTVQITPGDYLLTTPFTFGGQDNVVLWIMPGVVLTGSALPTASGNNFIIDWRSGNVGTASPPVLIAGTSDAIQLKVRGFSTQTNDIFVVETSDEVDVFQVQTTGVIVTGTFSVSGVTGLGGTNSTTAELLVAQGAGTVPTLDGATGAVFQNNDAAGRDSMITILSGSSGSGIINFADASDENRGVFSYLQTDDTYHWRGGASNDRMILDSSGDLTIAGNLVVSGTGPHAIGGATEGNTRLHLLGNHTSDGSSSVATATRFSGTITGVIGDTTFIVGSRFGNNVTTQGTDTNIGIIAQVYIQEPSITNNLASAGKPDVAASLYIADEPTEGDVNAALYIATGNQVINTGKLGIGEANPQEELHITAAGNVRIFMEDSNASSDEKVWSISNDGQFFAISIFDDAYSFSNSPISIRRNGTGLTSVSIGVTGAAITLSDNVTIDGNLIMPTNSDISFGGNSLATASSNGTVLVMLNNPWTSINIGVNSNPITIDSPTTFSDTLAVTGESTYADEQIITAGAVNGATAGLHLGFSSNIGVVSSTHPGTANLALQIQGLTIDVQANGVTAGTWNGTGLTIANSLIVSGTGPHAIGGATSSFNQLTLLGSFTSSGTSVRASTLSFQSTLTGAGGDTTSLAIIEAGALTGASIVTQTATETITTIATMLLSEPGITDNLTGDITVAATLYIATAPTEGETNAALYIASGAVNFQGTLLTVGIASFTTDITVGGSLDMGSGPPSGLPNGNVGMTNNTGFSWRNAGNTANITGLLVTSGDVFNVGVDSDITSITIGDSSFTTTVAGELEVDGAFNHDGSTFGVLNTTPQAQQAHIVDADGTLADITTKFNVLLADLEGFGFHATS